MGAFVRAALAFPTVVFSAALLVVLLCWLLVAVGAAYPEGFEGPLGSRVWGLGGLPVAVGFSLLTAGAWLLSLTGGALLDEARLSPAQHSAAGAGLLVAAPLATWPLARAAARGVAGFLPADSGPSRQDFVGLTCTVRTRWVDERFGQAEVTAEDGSSALVQVRQNGTGRLTLGSTGLLYAYDDEGEFFWIAPYEAALDPRRALD
ncbi:hypothetical protein [Streptomyces sp. 891-h]|uniref:hypothetical protein n=1 Tax=unclassified Streptomyces TaxID=2593676 RepID=UPI001FA96FF1|nr:hypothetical protein [Streptomyces sp. 891-h]UNZ19268.1 hypothetical protein HC362_21730 [Streptomyces sp. 891-h]